MPSDDDSAFDTDASSIFALTGLSCILVPWALAKLFHLLAGKPSEPQQHVDTEHAHADGHSRNKGDGHHIDHGTAQQSLLSLFLSLDSRASCMDLNTP